MLRTNMLGTTRAPPSGQTRAALSNGNPLQTTPVRPQVARTGGTSSASTLDGLQNFLFCFLQILFFFLETMWIEKNNITRQITLNLVERRCLPICS